MWRTIIGDAAVATGQDAQATAESLVGPMEPEAAAAEFESRIETISSASQTPLPVTELAVDLKLDQSQCNRWLIALEDLEQSESKLDARSDAVGGAQGAGIGASKAEMRLPMWHGKHELSAGTRQP